MRIGERGVRRVARGKRGKEEKRKRGKEERRKSGKGRNGGENGKRR